MRWHTPSAVRTLWTLVGRHHREIVLRVAYTIWASESRQRFQRLADGNRDRMCAEIIQHFDAKSGYLTFARQRHFCPIGAVRSVRVAAQQVLDPILNPFDMASAGLARQQCHTNDRVGKNLRAEGAAVR